MGYVQDNLMPNEKVLFLAKIHWKVYLRGIVLLLMALIFIGIKAVSIILALVGIYSLVTAFIFMRTSELAITSKRVIAKFGLISRVTIELTHNQVESLRVTQGAIDRVLNAGTILIQGTGGNTTPIPSISNPLRFRKEYFNIIESSKKEDKI